jgi:8-oxo-dGTP pyrophosphatase MutT (NUDIX family)
MSNALIGSLRLRLDGRPPDRLALERFAPSHTLRQRFEQAPSDARPAAVMVLLYRDWDEWKFPLVLRPNHLRHHQGQIALPGGANDPGESLQETALRELNEELGIAPNAVEIVGKLTPFYVPASRFIVHPWVGWAAQPLHFQPNPDEVADLLETHLRSILDPSDLAIEHRELAGQQVAVPYFSVGPHKVWGATCIVLGELAMLCEGLMEQVIGDR